MRVGTGRPVPRLTLDLLAALRFLDLDTRAAGKGRLFAAEARALLRVVGQYVTTERDPALYSYPVDA